MNGAGKNAQRETMHVLPHIWKLHLNFLTCYLNWSTQGNQETSKGQ